jgi:ABC-type sugar transport system ATPase subunit
LEFFPDDRRSAAVRRAGLKAVVVGIRPQNLSFEPRPPGDSIRATVALDEYLGEQSIVTLQAEDQAFRMLAPPHVQRPPGETMTLYYRNSDVMVFDPNTDRFVG